MRPELDLIVREWMNVEGSINRRYLNQYTNRYSLLNIEQIIWERVKKLYVMGIEPREDTEMPRTYEEWGTGCFVDDTGYWVLLIGADAKQLSAVLPRCGSNLKVLDMRFLAYPELHVAHLENLESLRVSMMRDEVMIDGLDALTRLEELDLSFTDYLAKRIVHVGEDYSERGKIDLSGLKKLRKLDLTCLGTLRQIEGLSELSELQELDLSGTDVQKLDVSANRKMKRLRLVDTRFLEYIEGLEAMAELEYLDLACSGIRRIPDGIRHLKQLRKLDLTGSYLEDLPGWLTEMGLKFTSQGDGINLRGTLFPGDPEYVFGRIPRQSPEEFNEKARQIITDWNNNVPRPLDETRVVFLGDGLAGKSHILSRLRSDGGDPVDFKGMATPGIDIVNKTYTIRGREVQVHFWDFGGQESLYSMHRLFLSNRTLYVVVVDVGNNTQQERAKYWLQTVRSFADQSPVLLVLNQMDRREDANVRVEDLRQVYPHLTKVVYMSAKEDSQKKFVDGFLETLKEQIGKMQDQEEKFLPACFKLKTHLQKLEKPYIFRKDYDALAEEYGVSKADREKLLDRFNDLGIAYHAPALSGGKEYIVIRPMWITTAVSTILFNRPESSLNGMIRHDMIRSILEGDSDMPDIRRVAEESYSREDVEYVLRLMRAFWLSFPVENDTEFIPMLCEPRKPFAREEAPQPLNALKFRLKFDYLPPYLLHRLMVEMRGELDHDRVWQTSACFAKPDRGISAEVSGDKNTLEIVVGSDHPGRGSNMYLHTIRETIGRLSRELNLVPPVNIAVHKTDGQEVAIDYDDLIAAKRDGDTTYRAGNHRDEKRTYTMEELLKQTCEAEEWAQETLKKKLQTIGMQLRGEGAPRTQAGNGQDRSLRHVLNETVFAGLELAVSDVSAGGSDSETALDIRTDAQLPWGRLETVSMDEMGSWDLRLEQLLDHCRAQHMSFGILIGLADCEAAAFENLKLGYTEHIRGYSPGTSQLRYTMQIPVMAEDPRCDMIQCYYDCGGVPIMVIHVLAYKG